jgi:hypothetical protein
MPPETLMMRTPSFSGQELRPGRLRSVDRHQLATFSTILIDV